MRISTADLVDKVKSLSASSQNLSSEVACASQDLKTHANHLAVLTQGSRSGAEATNIIRESARALADVAAKISLVMSACDDYIRNAVG